MWPSLLDILKFLQVLFSFCYKEGEIISTLWDFYKYSTNIYFKAFYKCENLQFLLWTEPLSFILPKAGVGQFTWHTFPGLSLSVKFCTSWVKRTGWVTFLEQLVALQLSLFLFPPKVLIHIWKNTWDFSVT